jgi:hypothetical protein
MGTTPWAGNGLIGSKADALAALQRVNAQAQTRGATALLPQPVTTGTNTAPAADVTGSLPVHPDLEPLLPWAGGMKRGVTVTVTGSTSLLNLLISTTMTTNGSYAAVVGMHTYGVLAAVQDYGIPAGQLALVPEPGPDWPTIVGALLDGLDVVVVQPPADVPAALARSLSSRARQKGSVLIPTRPWPGAELALEADTPTWHGLRDGSGRLRHCDLTVRSVGRGKAVRSRTATLSLPPGAKRPPVAFPPPRTAPAGPPTADSPLWEQVTPTPPPADPWADLARSR